MIIRITRKTLERESRAFFARQCSCFHQYRTGMTCVRIPGISVFYRQRVSDERGSCSVFLSLSLSLSLIRAPTSRYFQKDPRDFARGNASDPAEGRELIHRAALPRQNGEGGRRWGRGRERGGGEGGPSSARVQDNEISRDVRRTRFHSGRGRVTRGRGGLERARDSKRGGSERARAASCATEREEPRQVGGRRPDPPILSRCVHPNRKEERIRTSEHARMHAHVSLRAMCARRNYRIIDIISEFPERILSPSSPRRKERSVRTVRSTLTV